MEIATLAATVAAFLSPFLPELLKSGAQETGKKLVGAAWDKAKALWAKLWPQVEQDALAKAAAEAVVKQPEDPKARGFLELQLENLLKSDKSLAREIAALVTEGQQAGVIAIIIATGERSVAIGGSATGTTIITGDQRKD